MIEYIPPSKIAGNTLSGQTQLNGPDVLASIQMVLVQDYDAQMSNLGRQIKTTVAVKKSHRAQIEKFQKLLTMERTKQKDRHGENEKECVGLLSGAFSDYQIMYDYTGDPTTLESIPYQTDTFGEVPSHNQTTNNDGNTVYYVAIDTIEKTVENMKLKLDSLNEQGELNSLSLQSLTNQRKVTFESISNLVSKEHDGIATIVRNMKS